MSDPVEETHSEECACVACECDNDLEGDHRHFLIENLKPEEVVFLMERCFSVKPRIMHPVLECLRARAPLCWPASTFTFEYNAESEEMLESVTLKNSTMDIDIGPEEHDRNLYWITACVTEVLKE